MKYFHQFKFAVLSLIVILGVGCKKNYLDVRPSDAITLDQAYASVAAVNSSVASSYLTTFSFGSGNGNTGHDNYGQKSIDLANDLMGNDMVVHSQGYGWYNSDYNYTAWTLPNGTGTRSDKTWSFYYNIIKQANQLLDNTANQASNTEIQTLRGEALGLRAWAYTYLINNFQQSFKGNESAKGVPVYITISPETKGRGTVQEVYTQIVKDLTDAEALLTGKTRTSKERIDVSVIRGFRARVALIMEDWATAASYAKSARTGYSLMSNSVYTSRSGFSSISNSEWMWGALITSDKATIYASFFSHMDASQGGYATLGGQKKITKDLYDKIPATDIRKSVFTAPGAGTASIPDYTQIKFRVPVVGSWAADYLYMRAAEMYLIEAEALARQGKNTEARTVIESLVQPRDASYSAAGFADATLVNEVLLQRRIELWGEGFSLYDIKRTGTGLNRPSGPGNHGAPNFNPAVYTLPAGSSLFLMRIPQRELDNNPKMTAADQNP
ncbi:MAG: RagB/SusD family nutrient uptake outer membrane protein [Chitinophagaceae bacterium]